MDEEEEMYESKPLTVSVPPLVLVEAIECTKSKKNPGRLLYKKRRHCFYCGFYCEQIYRDNLKPKHIFTEKSKFKLKTV